MPDDRNRPAAYTDLCADARAEAENFGACYPDASRLLRALADALEHLTGTETVRLVHPDGGRVVVSLPIDVEVFAKVCSLLAKDGFDFDRADAPPRSRTFPVVLADKPRDILVHLVEQGPATGHELATAFRDHEGSVFTGGLNLLRELGLVRGPINEHDQTYAATDDGRGLVEAARAAAEETEEVRDAG